MAARLSIRYLLHAKLAGLIILFITFAGTVYSQTVLSGNQAAVEITNRTNLTRYKDNLKKLGSYGSRTFDASGPTASNDSGVAYVKREMEGVGYQVTVYGNYHSVFWTKVGTVSPDSMYLVSAHIDGLGGAGGAIDDNASGSVLVLEAARAFADSAIKTRCSIRFFTWNAHELGWKGSDEYVKARRGLQGKEDPLDSKRYPEPVWKALINSDMLLWDHGMPYGPNQIAGADIDLHYHTSCFPTQSLAICQQLAAIDKVVSINYPSQINTNLFGSDAVVFVNLNACPCVDLRENDRIDEIGKGSNPNHHHSTDVYNTYSDADFALGYSAVRRVVGALSNLANATVKIGGTDVKPLSRSTVPAFCTSATRTYDASGKATSRPEGSHHTHTVKRLFR